MNLFYLVLVLGHGAVVMPHQYTKLECYAAALEMRDVAVQAICVPAPK